MAIIIRCDICGNSSENKKTYFSEDPLVSTIPAKNGDKNFRVSLYFDLVDEKDYELQQRLTQLTEEEVYNLVLQSGAINIRTPNPHVCEHCKNYILHEWMINAHLENGFVFDSNAGDTMFIGKDRRLKLAKNVKVVHKKATRPNIAGTELPDKDTKSETRQKRRDARKRRALEELANDIEQIDPEADGTAE